MSRNANGEGSIYPWKRDGKPAGYKGALSYKDENGDTKRYVCYGRTRKDVKDKLDKARTASPLARRCGTLSRPLASGSSTGGLAGWPHRTARIPRKLSTERWRGSTWSQPHSARFDSTSSNRPTLIAFLLSLRERTKPLSDSTVFNIYTVLRVGLDGAIRDGLIARNAAALVDRPQVEAKEAKYISAADMAKLLGSAAGLRYRDVLVLIASTGLRRGEALAVSWQHVNFEASTLRVEGTLGRVGGKLIITEPKTKRSRRTVPLSPAMITLLKAWKVRQAAERLRAGNQWADTGLVFTTELGTPVEPRNILRTVEIAAGKAGIDHIGVHTIRHSAATAWLESGIHIKAVADLLGHSSISITGDIYGHTSDDTARKAIEG